MIMDAILMDGIIFILLIVFIYLGYKMIKYLFTDDSLPPTQKQPESRPVLIYGKEGEHRGFLWRIDALKKTLDSIEKIDYSGAKTVTESIKQSLSFIEAKLYSTSFNEFISKNLGLDDIEWRAVKMLHDRLSACEKAAKILAEAIVFQELGSAKEIEEATRKAQDILLKQQAEDIDQPSDEERLGKGNDNQALMG